MKNNLLKTLGLATVLASSISTANALVYGQLDLGYGSSQIEHMPKKESFVARPTIGLSFGNSYIGVDYTHWGTKKFLGLEAKTQTYGLKYTYRFDLPVIKPYVGGRLNTTNVKYNSTYTSDNHFGYGVLGGVEFKLLPLVSLGAGVEWNKLTSQTNNVYYSTFIKVDF